MPDTKVYDFVVGALRDITSQPKVSRKDHLIRDLALDSVDVLDALEQIEDEFGLNIPTDILPRLQTVEDLVSEVELRMNPPRSSKDSSS